MSNPNFWFMHLGKDGQHEWGANEKNIVSIDFGATKSPENLSNWQDIRGHMDEVEPNEKDDSKKIHADEINMFVNEMKKDDIVICSFKNKILESGIKLHIGKITERGCKREDVLLVWEDGNSRTESLLTHEVEWLIQESLKNNIFWQNLPTGNHLWNLAEVGGLPIFRATITKLKDSDGDWIQKIIDEHGI